MSDNFSAINIKVNGEWVPAVVLKGDKGDSFRYENLTEEQLKELKKAIGVGELPSNIATIDKEGKVGNVYDKSQVVNLLETNSKNIGNTDLQVPAGTVRTLNVEGAKFQIKGKANANNDTSFNRRPVENANGEQRYVEASALIKKDALNAMQTMSDAENLKLNPEDWKDIDKIC